MKITIAGNVPVPRGTREVTIKFTRFSIFSYLLLLVIIFFIAFLYGIAIGTSGIYYKAVDTIIPNPEGVSAESGRGRLYQTTTAAIRNLLLKVDRGAQGRVTMAELDATIKRAAHSADGASTSSQWCSDDTKVIKEEMSQIRAEVIAAANDSAETNDIFRQFFLLVKEECNVD